MITNDGTFVSRLRYAVAMPFVFRRACNNSIAQGVKALFVRGLSATLKTSLPQRLVRFRPTGFSSDVFVRLGTTDCKILEELLVAGTYADIPKLPMPKSPVIVDLGANTGLACAFFLTHFPTARIVAVEPDTANCETFNLNTKVVGVKASISLTRGFIAATEGMADISRRNGACAFQKCAIGEGAGESIPCVSMKRLLEDAGVQEIDLLKCDIEGAEAELFPSCSEWIGRVRYLVIECHGGYMPKQLYADLEKCGYHFDILDEKPGNVCLLGRKS
jgi:FkbM family methyltransferase